MDFFQWAVHFFVACYQMIIYCYAHLYAIHNQISKKIHMLCFRRTQCCNFDSWLIADDESSILYLPCTFAIMLNRKVTTLTSDAVFLEYKTGISTTAIFVFSVPQWGRVH